jgi:hypothetical protein
MPGGLPKRTARALLDIEDDKIVPIIRDPQKVGAPDYDGDAVFYFPGCGSERLFSQVALATQAMLYEIGAQTVLPPGYLCCGYPQTAAGEADQGQKITTDNRVLFHRVANTLNYLDIRTVIVSCGTCMDQLEKYHFEQIFPGCRLLDIHEYLLEKGVRLDGVSGTRYLYHDPCHAPMRTLPGIKVVNSLIGQPVEALRTLLRRIGNAGSHTSGRVHAGALPQAGRNRERRRQTPRRRLHRQHQGPHLLPLVPAGPVALQRRRRHPGRLHRRRNGQAPARPRLDGELRRQGQQRGNRTGVAVAAVDREHGKNLGEIMRGQSALRIVERRPDPRRDGNRLTWVRPTLQSP